MAKIKQSKLNSISYYDEYKASRAKKDKEEEREAEKSASASSPKLETGRAKIKQSKLDNISGYSEYKAKTDSASKKNDTGTTAYLDAARNATRATIPSSTSNLSLAEKTQRRNALKAELEELTERSRIARQKETAAWRGNATALQRQAAEEGIEISNRINEINKELESLDQPDTISYVDQLKDELEAARERAYKAQRATAQYSGNLGGRALAQLPAEQRKALYTELNEANAAVDALERELEQIEYLNEWQDVKLEKDNFWDQARANYRVGRITQDTNEAFSDYLLNPTEANKNYAYALEELLGQYQTNNATQLDDENAKLPWLSKTAAGYVPQFVDQAKATVGGGIVGGLGGAAVGHPIGGIKLGATVGSSMESYEQMRGAAYRALIAAGMDEESARSAANDEAFVSALIEGAGTYLAFTSLGGSKLLNTLGNAAIKSGSKNTAVKMVASAFGKTATDKLASQATKEAGKSVLRKGAELLGGLAFEAGQEYVEEGAQESVSIANQNREGTGKWDLVKEAAGLIGDAFTGKNDEAREQITAAGEEGAKIALMFGGTTAVANTVVSNMANAKTKSERDAVVNAVLNDKESLTALIEEGKASGENSVSAKIAQEIEQKITSGKEVTKDDVRKLIVSTSEYIKAESATQTTETEQDSVDATLAEVAHEAVSRETSANAPQSAQERSLVEGEETLAQNARTAQASPIEALNAAATASVPYNVLNRQANTAKKADPGYGEVGTKTFMDIVENSAESADKVRSQFQTAYELGKLETPREKISLQGTIQESAYNAGRQDAILSMKKAETKGATVWGKEGGLIQNEYSSKLDSRTTDTLQKIGKATGTKIIFDAQVGGGDANGAYVDNEGTIHIAADATNPVMVVVKHELTHRMQALAPKEYTQFRNYAVQVMSEGRWDMHGSNTAVEAKQNEYYQASRGRVVLTNEQAMDEIAADFTERILTDEQALNDFVSHVTSSKDETTRSMGQKFFQAVREFIDKVKRIFKGDKAKMDDAARDEYGVTIAQLEKAEALWKEAYKAAESRAQKETKNTAQEDGEVRYSINKSFAADINEWNRNGRRDGELFVLGSTGSVLQGLGAIENDIYMMGDKIKTILADHPEMTLAEIKKIPQMLEDPVFIIGSKGHGKSKRNSRLVIFGTIKAQNGQPVMSVLDLRPVENHLVVDDMQKVNSAYTKDNPVGFITSSEVLHADKKRTIPLLRTMGLQLRPIDLLRSGSIGSITYKGDFVNIHGEPFASVFGKPQSEAIEFSDRDTQFSLREKEPPKKVGIAYKVFYAKNGQLYPPMVANPGGEGTPVGVWLDADVAASAPPSKTGRPQVQAGGKGTNAGKMSLAFRPGWHLGDLPMATQFARKNPETGVKDLFPADFVWAECEYAMDHDYQEEAMSYGYTENGKFRHSYAGLPRLPEDGYYRYRTNPNPDTVPWVITGAMRVKRILTDAETDKILRDAGVEPMKRQGGELNLEKLGLTAGEQYSLKDKGYMTAVESGDMETAQRMVDEAAKAAMPDSKIVNADGRLKKVYHGSPSQFNVFDFSKIGNTGHQEGFGFYFADTEKITRNYGSSRAFYLDMQRPMYSDKRTITMGEIVKFIKALDPDGDGVISMYEDVGRVGYSAAARRAAAAIMEYNDNDQDIIFEIANSDGSNYTADEFLVFAKTLKDTLGIDGLVSKWEAGQVYVVFDNKQMKLADAVTRNDSGNVIPLSKRFDRSNDDIRFSLKDQSKMMRDNARLKEVNAALKAQLQVTKFAKVDPKELKNLARKLRKDYDSNVDIDDLQNDLDTLYTFLANDDPAAITATSEEALSALANSEDEFSQPSKWNTAYRMAYEIAQSVIRDASALNDDMYREYEGVRNYLRTVGISMSKDYEHDLMGYEDLSDFRKRNFGRIKIVKNGLDVNTAYNELANMYPALFDDYEHSHPGDQLVHLADVLDSLQPIEENPFSYEMREVATWLANDIMERFFELPQAKPTFADKAQRKLTEQVIKDTKKLEQVREQSKERTAKIIAEYREKVKEVRSKEKAEKWKKVDETKAHYKEKEAKMSESRRASAIRARIIRHASDLKERLLRPTDKKHIPQELQGAVAKLLESINMESGYDYDPNTMRYTKKGARIGDRVEKGEGIATKRTQAFAELQSVYAQLVNELTVDPDLLGDDGLLNEVIKMADKPLASMTSAELQTVWETLRAVEASVRTANKMHAAERWQTVTEVADALREDNKGKKQKTELRGPLGKGQTLVGLDMETPETYFHMLGDAGDGIFRMMRNAQDQHIRLMKEVADFTHATLGEINVRKLESEMHEVTLGGEKVELSTAQIMELYVLTKREQAIDHIFVGGILPDVVSAKGLKKITKAKPVRGITLGDVGDAVKLLTDEQVKLAEKLQAYASGTLSRWGNKTSMDVYGYEKFGEKNYWPIRVNRQEIKSDVQKDTAVTSLANRSFTKGTRPHANNSLRLGSIFDTFATHSSEMATYAAWLGTLEDVNRIRNFTFKDEIGHAEDTVKGIIDTVHGTGGNAYLDKLLADVTNGVKGTHGETKYMSGIMGNFKAAAVGANLRVIIQQPTAMLRAADMIGAQYMATPGNPLNGWKKAKKYAPIAQWKDWGYFDINTGRQMKDVLFDSDTALDRAKNISMWGAGAADSVAWGHLWNAVEAETKAKHKDLKPDTEAFYKAVAERFTEIVDHTQVVDGILQRSQIMRNTDGITKMATSFMGEPTKQYNMMMQAAYDAKGTSGKDRKAAVKKLARTATVLAISGIANAMAQSIIDAVRDDDKEKEYWEKWLAAFKENAVSTFNPVSYIPFAKDVLSILQGYDVTRMDMESIEKLVSAGQNMIKALSGEGKHTVGGAAINLIAEVSRLVGLPVSNLKREITSFSMLAAVENDNYLMQYRMEKWALNMNNNGAKFVDILFNAYQNDKEAYEIIYADMVASGYDPEKIQNGMENRMKKDQGVSKVDDLEQRYLTPEQQPEYDKLLGTIQKNGLWSRADEEQKDNLEARLYSYVAGTASGLEMAEKLDDAKNYGIDETEYLLYKLALEMYDTRNKNGEFGGTPTNAEKANAISAMGNLSDGEIAYLWDTDKGYEAYASGVDMGAYVDYLGAGGSVSVDKLIDAQDYGIGTEKYLDFLDMLDKYDQPSKSGKYGSFTQDEAADAVAAMTGLTNEQRAYLWQSVNKSWKSKSNPWR